MPEFDEPIAAFALLLAIMSVLLVAMAMDVRKLPFGRIKYVLWTYITLTAMTALLFAGRHLFDVMTNRL